MRSKVVQKLFPVLGLVFTGIVAVRLYLDGQRGLILLVALAAAFYFVLRLFLGLGEQRGGGDEP